MSWPDMIRDHEFIQRQQLVAKRSSEGEVGSLRVLPVQLGYRLVNNHLCSESAERVT